jgi:hypothetical protein
MNRVRLPEWIGLQAVQLLVCPAMQARHSTNLVLALPRRHGTTCLYNTMSWSVSTPINGNGLEMYWLSVV